MASLFAAVEVTVTLTASPGTEVVTKFTTSFPVGPQLTGQVEQSLKGESDAKLSGSFYTDNGLELVHRKRRDAK